MYILFYYTNRLVFRKFVRLPEYPYLCALKPTINRRSLEKLRHILKYFLPLLFLSYWGGVTLFTHSHVVNGVIMVHSHPFKAGHQHTSGQAETILFLDHYEASSVPVLLAAVPCFCALLGLLAVVRRTRLYLTRLGDGIRLRAPPLLCLLRLT